MSATIPGSASYQSEPFALTVNEAVTTIPITSTGWPTDAEGNYAAVAQLMVTVKTDGRQVVVCGSASSASFALFPDDVEQKASLSGSTSISLRTAPIEREEAAATRLRASADGTSVVCRWRTIPEWGD